MGITGHMDIRGDLDRVGEAAGDEVVVTEEEDVDRFSLTNLMNTIYSSSKNK